MGSSRLLARMHSGYRGLAARWLPRRRTRGLPVRPCRFEPLEPRQVLAGDLCITEFMASNNGALLDAYGDGSDWVELFNTTSQSLDLSDYYLTDDAQDLEKYRLPAVNLDAGGTLVVFASGRDEVLPDGEIHTNFSLRAQGDYLALVDSQGVVSQDFGATYPPQLPDVSYGVETTTTAGSVALIPPGPTGVYLLPTQDIGSQWTQPGFADAHWSAATLPIGYETGTGYENLIATNVSSGTTSAYLRIPFELTNLSSVSNLALAARYDDGFVAYLNGQEVVRVGAPESLDWDSSATDNHTDSLAVQFQSFDISLFQSHLRVGENVLAVQALNVDSSSSDFLFDVSLTGQQTTILQPLQTGFLAEPTPGIAQGAVYNGFVQDVQFGLPHGFYDAPQSLALTTSTAGATIVYTRDGSDPVVDPDTLAPINGTVYSGPIVIDATTVIRAAAFALEQVPSTSRAQTYLFVGDIIHQSPSNETPAGWPDNGDPTLNGQYMDYGMDPVILSQYGTAAVEDALQAVSTISITTDLENLFDQQSGLYSNASDRGRVTEKFVSVELIEPDGSGGFQSNAGMRIRGGYSRNDWFPKHNFRLFFRSEYGDAKLEYPVFGAEGASDFDVLDLRSAQNYSWAEAGSTRMTFLREIFSRDLQADMGHPATRSKYHHLYINGIYWGVYQTQERVEAYFGESYFGGDKDDYDRVKADNSNGLRVHFPDGNSQAWYQTFFLAQGLADNPAGNADNYWTLQGRNPDGTRNPDLPVLLDVDNLIDYMMILFYTGATDTGFTVWSNPSNLLSNNWVALRNRETNDQGWQFFVHDNEHSMGINRGVQINGVTQPTHQDRTGPFNEGLQDSFNFSSPPFLHQDLLVHPEYRVRWQDRVQRHFFQQGALTPASNGTRWDARQQVVDDVIIAHAARWGDRFDTDFSGDLPRNRSTWLSEVNWVRHGYIAQRNPIVLGQLAEDDLYSELAPVTFNQWGGVVADGFVASLATTNAGGAILFTTDGSDPRNIGGSINPAASVYSSGLTVNQTLTIRARVRLNSGQWSALTEATFRLPATPADATNFAVNEINYHPQAPTAAELLLVPSATDSSFEFIEFVNRGPTDIDLAGVQLTQPFLFSFPAMNLAAGERVLVVRDQNAFVARYPNALPIAGAYGAGSALPNGGGLVTLTSAGGATIQQFAYDDSGNWPSLADGEGHTLQVVAMEADYNDPMNWLPSRNAAGDPGADGTPALSHAGIRITEINYHPVAEQGAEFVEIQNTSNAPIDLTGFRFVEGITFDFSLSSIDTLMPGEIALVVRDSVRMNEVYGAGLPIAGQYDGALANDGERITLFDAQGDRVHDFVYSDVLPWATDADGLGSSLEIVATEGDYGDPLNWQSSAAPGGTPGTVSQWALCDFVGNENGCDIADLDALYTGTPPAPGPLTEDLIDAWLAAASDPLNPAKSNASERYVKGDTNLDGDVDSADLGVLLNNFGDGSGLLWGAGNLDGDSQIGSADLGLLLNRFGYASASGADAIASSIPDSSIPDSSIPDSSIPPLNDWQSSVADPETRRLLSRSFSLRDLVFGEMDA